MVALVDADDPYHERCVKAAANLDPQMVTTWPCLTEAMHLLYRAGGLSAQNELWSTISRGILRIHLPNAEELHRIPELMNEYADLPLDMADASLVSAAEQLNDFHVFSVDKSLRVVRASGRRHFDVVP